MSDRSNFDLYWPPLTPGQPKYYTSYQQLSIGDIRYECETIHCSQYTWSALIKIGTSNFKCGCRNVDPTVNPNILYFPYSPDSNTLCTKTCDGIDIYDNCPDEYSIVIWNKIINPTNPNTWPAINDNKADVKNENIATWIIAVIVVAVVIVVVGVIVGVVYYIRKNRTLSVFNSENPAASTEE